MINVSSIFKDGDVLVDKYSGKEVKVNNGKVVFNTDFEVVLLEKKE